MKTDRFFNLVPSLFLTSLIHFVLFLITIPGLFLDERLVTGINPWIKPIKFDLSIAIYSFTLAWILKDLPLKIRNSIGLKISICLWVEITLIYFQAFRGIRSHFNQESVLNGAIFSIMGMFITYNTWLIAKTGWYYWKTPPALPAIYVKSVQLGLVSLLIGSFLGGYMSSQLGHSVGITDGGPGLPFLNWSTVAGDLRVAHFIGLHGIQIFLLMGLYFSRSKGKPSHTISYAALYGFFALFLIAVTAAFTQALMGRPLIAI